MEMQTGSMQVDASFSTQAHALGIHGSYTIYIFVFSVDIHTLSFNPDFLFSRFLLLLLLCCWVVVFLIRKVPKWRASKTRGSLSLNKETKVIKEEKK